MKTILIAGFGLCLLSLVSQTARADWGSRSRRDGGGRAYYDRGRYDHDHHGGFRIGIDLGSLFHPPEPRFTRVIVAGTPYYYSDGVWYQAVPGGYVAVNPPFQSAPSPVATTGFYQQGYDWAAGLRNDSVTRDQFVDYLRSNIIRASTARRDQFREGFLAAYGVNGKAAFEKAYSRAWAD